MGIYIVKVSVLIVIGAFLSSQGANASPRFHKSTLMTSIQNRVKGENVEQGESPYQLSLQLYVGYHFCGASLTIVNGVQVAITAASCLEDLYDKQLSVVAGDIDLDDTTGIEQRRKIHSRVIHDNFGTEPLLNDLAILFLEQPFQLDNNVGAIDLPQEYEETEGDIIISGWGDKYGDTGNVLQKVIMHVVDSEVCREKWQTYPYSPLPEIGDDIICSNVESGVQGLIYGDIGTPAKSKNGNYLAGIVSYFDDMIWSTDYPAGLTKVSKYFSWIKQQVSVYLASKNATIQNNY